MIRRLKIDNLKSLGGHHDVELAPITLVYGPNSAGKSSLLQSLAVLKQTLEPRVARVDIERQPLNLGGELVDLGSFGAAIHRHDLTAHLGFGVEFTGDVPYFRTRDRPGPSPARYVSLSFAFDAKQHAVDQHDVLVGVGDTTVRFVPTHAPAQQQELLGPTERFFRVASKDDGRKLLAMASSVFGDNPDGLREGITELLEAEPRPYFFANGFFPTTPFLRQWRDKDTRGSTRRPIGQLIPYINEIVWGSALALTETLSQLAYLGPLRAAPTRFQARSGEVYSSVGSRGEHTPLLLLQQPGLLGPVNEWLERLGIEYHLDVETLESESIGLEIGDLVVTRLVDKRSQLAVTPQDVGFGISQLLPVVVQVLAGQGRTICVEQPEIHIHPRLQAEVGDLLIEAAKRHGNQVIVETHSEHLMLRLQRRIREQELSHDMVKVLYVEIDGDGVARPRELRLDEHGDFIDEWPQGFFAERMNELFSSAGPPRRRTVGRKGNSAQ
jgi:energy-coupling factor transporter ATP-binding protein EcfA2